MSRRCSAHDFHSLLAALVHRPNGGRSGVAVVPGSIAATTYPSATAAAADPRYVRARSGDGIRQIRQS